MFHVEISSLPIDFLAKVFRSSLPVGSGQVLVYKGVEATIYARLIDPFAVRRHLDDWQVKSNSPMLAKLLGGDWAPVNSSATIAHIVKMAYVKGCDAPVLGTYIQEMNWACGFTRDFDSEISLDKKAKDVTSLLSDAVSQVPVDRASVIHIAAETMEGPCVERLRTKKVMETIRSFKFDKPVVAVRFHRFLANQTIDKIWEFDETVERFHVDGFPDDELPESVVVPEGTEMKDGAHWEIYP